MSAPTEMVVFDSIANSSMSPRKKSQIMQWVEKVSGKSLTKEISPMAAVHETGRSVRQYGEAGIVGLLLGAAHVELKTGLDVKGVPIDGAMAAGGAIGSVVAAGMGYGEITPELRNIGSHALTIFSFRKIYDVLAEKKIQSGGIVGGTFGPSQKAKIAGEFSAPDIGQDPMARSRGNAYGRGHGTGRPQSVDPIVAAARALE